MPGRMDGQPRLSSGSFSTDQWPVAPCRPSDHAPTRARARARARAIRAVESGVRPQPARGTTRVIDRQPSVTDGPRSTLTVDSPRLGARPTRRGSVAAAVDVRLRPRGHRRSAKRRGRTTVRGLAICKRDYRSGDESFRRAETIAAVAASATSPCGTWRLRRLSATCMDGVGVVRTKNRSVDRLREVRCLLSAAAAAATAAAAASNTCVW
jgi:hypothetical protein